MKVEDNRSTIVPPPALDGSFFAKRFFARRFFANRYFN